MRPARVVVLGGQGVFGTRIVRQLQRYPTLEVLVAGRRAPIAVDATRPDDVQRLLDLAPGVLVDCVGPFQARDLSLPRRCAQAGIHYVDIADNRARVAGIGALDELARLRDVLVVSGASTVPAISTAFVDALVSDAAEVLAIDVGISPGNRAPRGLATVTAILGYCGRPIPSAVPMRTGGPEHGWGDLTRHRYPQPVGLRWLSNVDTPERALWSTRYPQLERATLRAGLELGTLHLGLACLARGVRAGLLPPLDRFARPLLRVADAVEHWGTNSGAMHVRVECRNADETREHRMLTLLAEQGDGPQIPATPAVILVKKLLGLDGHMPLALRGAKPCMGMFTSAELMREFAGFAIRLQSGR